MSCDRRTYITGENLNGVALPPIPINPADWDDLRRFLEAVRKALSGKPLNKKPPGQVTNFIVTAKPGGNLLTWDKEKDSAYYILYSSLNNNFSLSRTIAVISEGSGTNCSFFDACGQRTPGARIFYWVQPYNSNASTGPLTLALGTEQECCTDDSSSDSSGGGCPTTFSDDFNRANVFAYGPNWSLLGYNLTSAFATYDLMDLASSQARIGMSSATGVQFVDRMAVPNPVIYSLQNLNQFCEMTFVSGDSAVGTRATYAGPGVLLHAYNGYALACDDVSPGRVFLSRVDGTPQPGKFLENPISSFTFTSGDRIRLEAVVGVADVTLTYYKNGILAGSYVDSDAARSTYGCPGMVGTLFLSGAGGCSQIWDDFSCGPLP